MNKLMICCTLAGALALAACSSSGSSTASPSSTSGAGSSSGGGANAGAGNASGRDLCASVTAADVQAITGETITAAKPLGSGSRFRSGFTGPSCVYTTTTGLGGVNAEFVAADSYQGLTTDPVTKPKALSGVGDEAFQAVDQVDGTKVIRTLAKKGDQYLFVQIYAGTTEANAKTLTNKLLG
jgi:hypothetical protein